MSYYLKTTIPLKVLAYPETNGPSKSHFIDLPAGTHVDYLGKVDNRAKFRFSHDLYEVDYIFTLPHALLNHHFTQIQLNNIAPAAGGGAAAGGQGGARRRRPRRSHSRRSRSRSRKN